jgi:hypothetical protein
LSYNRRIADEILSHLAKGAKELAMHYGQELVKKLAQDLLKGLEQWWDSNYDYARPAYQVAQQIPSNNGNRPLANIPFEQFYPRATLLPQYQQYYNQQYRQYLRNYIIARAATVWSGLAPNVLLSLNKNYNRYVLIKWLIERFLL